MNIIRKITSIHLSRLQLQLNKKRRKRFAVSVCVCDNLCDFLTSSFCLSPLLFLTRKFHNLVVLIICWYPGKLWMSNFALLEIKFILSSFVQTSGTDYWHGFVVSHSWYDCNYLFFCLGSNTVSFYYHPTPMTRHGTLGNYIKDSLQ